MMNLQQFTGSSHEAKLGRAWYEVVQMYSGLKLSILADKLPAISALAHRVQEYTEDGYVAGLWMEDLAEGIVWNTQPYNIPSRRTTSRSVAPSWSWASAHAVITFLKIGPPLSWNFVLAIEKVAMEPIGSDVAGLLRSATLRVNGRLRLFSLHKLGFKRTKNDPFL